MTETTGQKNSKPNRTHSLPAVGIFSACCLVVVGAAFWGYVSIMKDPAQERTKWRQEWFGKGAEMVLTNPSHGSDEKTRDVRLMKLANDSTLERDLEGIMLQPRLEGLVLTGMKVDLSVVERLRSHPSLKLLMLDDTSVSSKDIRNADTGLEIHSMSSNFLARLDELQVRRSRPFRWSPDDFTRFPDLWREMLTLADQEIIGSVDMQNVVVDRSVIEPLSEIDTLDYLRVGYGFDDEMATLLPTFQNVTKLDLSQSMITDAAVDVLLRMPKLRSVVLGPNMTDKTMSVLAKSQTIESMDCRFSQVGDEGVVAMKGSSAVTAITLSGRPITGRAMEALGEYPQLRDLRVSGCDYLTSSDLLAVYEMQHLRNLSAPLSNSMRDALQRRLPELKIAN